MLKGYSINWKCCLEVVGEEDLLQVSRGNSLKRIITGILSSNLLNLREIGRSQPSEALLSIHHSSVVHIHVDFVVD